MRLAPQVPDLADRSGAGGHDRRLVGAEITAGIDQHAAVDHDLIDIGAVGERDQRAARIEQRLKIRMDQIGDGEIGGRPRLDAAEVRPLDDVSGDRRVRLDQFGRVRDGAR
ncbi:hypothetical protein ACVW1A_003789 [Bradyrhizobium sp. LB1.3]